MSNQELTSLQTHQQSSTITLLFAKPITSTSNFSNSIILPHIFVYSNNADFIYLSIATALLKLDFRSAKR